MKKLGLLAMAFALVMTMTQCKKENTTVSNDEGVKVPITLNVSGGNSRVGVDTWSGVVYFEYGDVLYVASNGVFVGTLSYNGSNFYGQITEPTEGQKLQFYFLGNVNPEETLTEGTSTGCSINISNQTTKLPVISYAPSRENYEIGRTNYNATLLNKCALVKFNVTTLAATATCIKGMNNKVEIDFSTNNFEYTQEQEGVISLAVGSGERWAILLPQDALEEGEEGSAYSYGGGYSGVRPEIPAIAENDYLTDGIAIEINTPVGFVNGLFSVSATRQVYFSQGNLQYNKITNEWSFMEHQYDIVETNGQDIGENYANQDIISLFGWATSGYNHGAICYQPWSMMMDNKNYFAYVQYSSYNLFDQTGQADWGYNAIVNGGNQENSGWRTLTKQEWDYVIFNRAPNSGIRYAKATVGDVCGLLLLPDNWQTSIYNLTSPNATWSSYSSNTITIENWTNILEPNGVVFLPAAGERGGSETMMIDWIGNVGSDGYYWSATSGSSYNYAYRLTFDGNRFFNTNVDYRPCGMSVRLVRNAE
jgi:hypothetical protein